MKKEDIVFLNQLVNALDEATKKLETYSQNGDKYLFDKAKDFILQVQKKISEVAE